MKGKDLGLDYPCSWTYRVIGSHEDQIRIKIAAILGDRDHTVTLSNTSSGGKYTSLNLETVVFDDADRMGIFQSLKGMPEARIVL